MNFQAKEGVEIMGCCFRHTAIREQYMSNVVGDVLREEGVPVGNLPMAVWSYSIPAEPLPKVSIEV